MQNVLVSYMFRSIGKHIETEIDETDSSSFFLLPDPPPLIMSMFSREQTLFPLMEEYSEGIGFLTF